jgi:molybdopterin/thiamine biosynthesis adenylyltransferase
MSRYARQTILPEIGTKGQETLLKSHVLVIGAGGLGCPVIQYLAAGGIGKLTIVDDDVVAESNLQRQVLFRTSDIGKSKAKLAAEFARNLKGNYPCTITKADLPTDAYFLNLQKQVKCHRAARLECLVFWPERSELCKQTKSLRLFYNWMR